MSENPKNLLQEYFQKRKLPLPIYDTKQTGPPHLPNFVSTVKFTLGTYTNDDQYQKIQGETRKKAVDAEKSAAEIALQEITKYKRNFIVRDNNLLTILWDLENVNAKNFFENNSLNGSGLETVAFVTKYHPQASMSYPFTKLITIDSQHRDAADMALVMYLGSSITCGRGGSYIVVTQDHFATSLHTCVAKHVDIIPYKQINKNNSGFIEPTITQAQTVNHLVQLLDKHCSKS